jgi:hypothetical protein
MNEEYKQYDYVYCYRQFERFGDWLSKIIELEKN